jgi:hypothetical protein
VILKVVDGDSKLELTTAAGGYRRRSFTSCGADALRDAQ